MFDTWEKHVLRHLEAALAMCRTLVARERERGHRAVVEPIDGVLEWTLPWGMDDGLGGVRLTLAADPWAWDEPLRVRVVVAAAAEPFVPGRSAVVGLPRHDPGTAPGARVEPPTELTQRMATYLLEHVGGDADSLRGERAGAVSFTVVVAGPESAARE
ncbi:MAG TPA: hypothetical protein VE546_24745 [Streptomyces sp.]|uniref:hypothetical protein n=1 Tax=Streptomyces sp. TaxID=1931 RepID=UPI002D4428ED|nr:hypothetical protein [Streptomyces sp.]HZG06735.1 hypothetical protein [Streptomyces sp.]